MFLQTPLLKKLQIPEDRHDLHWALLSYRYLVGQGRVEALSTATVASTDTCLEVLLGLLTKKAIMMTSNPPVILKKHVVTPAMPRQVGPMGSVARALAARVMPAAAIPEQTLRPMYHQ